MKKIIALIIIISSFICLISCDKKSKDNEIQNNNNNSQSEEGFIIGQKQENNTTNSYEEQIEEKLKFGYDYSFKGLCWNKIKNAQTYDITINGITYYDQTGDTFYVDFLEEGTDYTATIKAKNNKKTIKEETISFKTGGFNNNLESDIKNIYSKSIVEITIEKYNKFLGIKTDKISETIEGVIIKAQDKTYWVATYSPILRTAGNYENTEIWIKDYNGNSTKATQEKLTEYNGTEIAILKYREISTYNEELPPIKLGNKLIKNTRDILIIQLRSSNLYETNQILNVCEMTIDGAKSKTPLMKTNYTYTNSQGCAILNNDFELVAISVGSIDGKLYAIQIGEILNYIDESLAYKAQITKRMGGYGVE